MTSQEIENYNCLCAEFLGGIYSEQAEAWGFGNVKNIGSKMFHGIMYHNVIKAQRFEKELKFHSDWNWIMEVVEKILKNYRTDFYLDFDMPVSDTFTVSIGSDGKYNSKGESTISSKEAVVKAINQFLIWYYENKTN